MAKTKRIGVLTNRTHRHHNEQSYRLLYKKLKNNNNYLAKMLSKEKQKSQLLFTQIIEQIKEIQRLNLIYNTQNAGISNIQNNIKEMLKMLIIITDYMTNTISICQKHITSNNTVRLSSISAGKKESTNTFLPKLPVKGVVKPMVGGYTITKPTINLSRIDMENINISRLSDIQEEDTLNRSQEINENRSPIAVPLATTPLRYENDRSCRLSDRIKTSSPRINKIYIEDEQRLRRKEGHHLKKLSASFSRSRNKWSDEISTTTIRHINIIDSQINFDNQKNNDTSQDLSNRNIISESQISINSNEGDKTYIGTLKKDIQINNKTSNKDFNKNSNLTKNSQLSQNKTWKKKDLLESPSWLFNNTMPSLDSNIEEISNLDESINNTPASEKDIAHVTDHTEYRSYLHENTDGNFCETLPTASVCNHEKSLDNAEDNIMKFTNFVTMKRGHFKALEEMENFTLLLPQSAKNRQFDIDELRLPVLGDSAINESSTNNKIDSEVTVTIPRITNISIASVLNRNLNESEYDRIMKLPLFINDHKRISEANQIKKSENSLDPSSAKVVFMNESSKFMNESHLKTRVLSANGTQSANSLRKESTSEEKSLRDSEKSLRDSENDIYTSGRPRRRKAPVNLKEPNLNTKLRRNE